MPLAVPGTPQDEPETDVPGEPEIMVPASVIGDTAELMTLVLELINTGPGIPRAIEALMDSKGVEPRPAADWMIASIAALAKRADSILAYEGIACDRGLALYWQNRLGTQPERT